jgi:hypothetical protein
VGGITNALHISAYHMELTQDLNTFGPTSQTRGWPACKQQSIIHSNDRYYLAESSSAEFCEQPSSIRVIVRIYLAEGYYQSKTIRGPKYVSYDEQLCPLIDKGQRAPNAQVTCQIVNRYNEELKSSSPDSQTLKNLV